jgi:predicted nucleic acid-binding protein
VTGPARGVLDTSIFIASESGRALDEAQLPEEAAISVITLAELHVGVLAARDTDTRSRRMATLNAVADVEVLPVDEAVALAWARLRVRLAESGRRVNLNDLWIAATAVSKDLPVITQDADYEPLQALGEVSVIHV